MLSLLAFDVCLCGIDVFEFIYFYVVFVDVNCFVNVVFHLELFVFFGCERSVIVIGKFLN